MGPHLKAWLATLVILESAREFSASTALVCRLNSVAVIAEVNTTAAGSTLLCQSIRFYAFLLT